MTQCVERLRIWEWPRRRRRERKRREHEQRMATMRATLDKTRTQIEQESRVETERTAQLIRALNAEVRMLRASRADENKDEGREHE